MSRSCRKLARERESPFFARRTGLRLSSGLEESIVDEDLKRIAARIRSWRDEAGLTLQQLGDRSNVSASTIHKIENLQTVPTIAVLLKVAHGLNRRPSELLAEVDVGRQVEVLQAAARLRGAAHLPLHVRVDGADQRGDALGHLGGHGLVRLDRAGQGLAFGGPGVPEGGH